MKSRLGARLVVVLTLATVAGYLAGWGLPAATGQEGSGAFDKALTGTPSSGHRAVALGTTSRASVSGRGDEGNDESNDPAIASDGQLVAFRSAADNLVTDDLNGVEDVFVRDMGSGTTELASVSSTGRQANAPSYAPAISADGRYVAFNSRATTLVSGDTNRATDVFVHDRATGDTERVSVDSLGIQGNSDSEAPSVSADGHYVAFHSFASNLVDGDNNSFYDIFVRDRWAGTTERVNLGPSGQQANNNSYSPSIDGAGHVVAFESRASNLVGGDTNSRNDVFVRDRWLPTTERVSVTATGKQANDHSYAPSISADGLQVAFTSVASNLATGDTNGTYDIFVRDRAAATTELESVSSTGEQGKQASYAVAIGADGRQVAFVSAASNLVPDDRNRAHDVFLRDRDLRATRIASISTAADAGNGDSTEIVASHDGRYVAFSSLASTLVPSDTNGVSDIFVRDDGCDPGDDPRRLLCPARRKW